MRHTTVSSFRALAARSNVPVFDVRTPAEFDKGCMPEAHNLPLFSNEDRAVVGTLYKDEGRKKAIRVGLDLVGPRMGELVDQVVDVLGQPVPEQPALVHCWRGGMRSQSVAWLLGLYGYDTHTLEGGYKAYRRDVLARISEVPPLIVLSGRTGSGKTAILHHLREIGHPVIDLEGLAEHRGSAFGSLVEDQPTQQSFENRLADALAVEGSRPVWIEDEGRMIGRNNVPQPVYKAIRTSPVVVVQVPLEDRVQNLVEDYGETPASELVEAFDRISKRLGRERAQMAIRSVENRDYANAARIALDYYDRAYDHGLSKRDPGTVHRIKVETSNVEALSEAVLEFQRTQL